MTTTEGTTMKTAVSFHWSAALESRNACREAVEYARTHDTFTAAWSACERGDWMIWLLGRLSGAPDSDSRRKLVLVAAECAELALPIYEKRYPNDTRVRDCIAACKRYAAGEIDMEQLRKYRAAAYAAYATASAAYADAYAADAAAYAADAAAYAAYDAASAAYAAAYAYARARIKKRCADTVRKHYPTPPEL